MVQPNLTLSMAVDGFLLARRAEGLSPNTLDQYAWACRKLAAHLAGDPPLAAVTTDDVRAFLASLNGLAPKSRHSIQVALSALWTWATAEGYAEAHVVKPIHLPKTFRPDVEPFTQVELRRLLQACDKSAAYSSRRHPAGTANSRPTATRDRAILIFLVDTGIRASELCALRVADVSMENRAVTIRSGKGGKPRVIHFAQRCHQALWRYQTGRQPHMAPGQPLFHVGPADLPEAFDRQVLGRLLARIGERAGVHCNPHRFRHTFALEFLRNGGNLFALQDLLGHSSLEMVRRYARIVQADHAAAHKIASPADNWRL
ncbi:MAG: hypothetical protein EHM56_13565 [Chloroflexi bacterium]|nr:MAG: hypothetical protein EHM56_13565 [Chloroflexota bacterium]